MGTSRQAHLVHAVAQQLLALLRELAELPNLPAGHLTVVAGAAGGEAPSLNFASSDNLVAHHAARRASAVVRKLFIRNGRHFDMNINPIEQRARDFGHVLFHLRYTAMAL